MFILEQAGGCVVKVSAHGSEGRGFTIFPTNSSGQATNALVSQFTKQ